MEKEKNTPQICRGTDCAKLVVLIQTEALAGAGTEADPYYIKRQYWAADGELIAERKV